MSIKLHHPIDRIIAWNLFFAIFFGVLIIGVVRWGDPDDSGNHLLAIWGFFFGSMTLALTLIRLYIPLKLMIAALFPFFIVSLLFCPLWVEDCHSIIIMIVPLWIGFKLLKLYLCFPILVVVYGAVLHWVNRQQPAHPL